MMRRGAPVLGITLLLTTGCMQRGAEVIVYAALDREFSEPILQRFTRETGIEVRAVYDVESTKTVGLTQRILAERARPRCDVFWNNEIVNTLRLQKAGLLERYVSPSAQPYPALFKSTDGTWHGFAARARVLVVNTRLVPKEAYPKSLLDLTAAPWKGRIGIAKPLFGTTATHAVCLFAVLGEEKAKQFFRDLKTNQIQILAGNKQVALSVAAGELAAGLTDTDDAMVQLRAGDPIELVYLDAQPQHMGTLFIPNTLALIKHGPHPQEARRLIDYLLSSSVERDLAMGPSAQIPLNPQVTVQAQVKTPQDIPALQVDFEKAARQWETVQQFLVEEFTTP